MRVMVRFSVPVETGNSAIRSGKVEKVLRQIQEELKPEAAYFMAVDGQRGGFFIVQMQDSSQIVEICERFFFGLNAKIEFVPVMAAEDLGKGLAGLKGIIENYG
jgi:hypothetical protein